MGKPHHGMAGSVNCGAAQSRLPAYFLRMNTFLVILVALAMLATLGVLFAGLLGLARNPGDGARSNRLMRYRIALQAAALVLFGLLLLLTRG